MLSLVSLLSIAHATCPSTEVIQGNLTCSSTFYGLVDHTEPSDLGGECADGDCYTCGEPYANEKQIAPEAVYTFHCQNSGTVLMEISDLPCDLDIYVLDNTCNPNTGCVQGSTQPYDTSDSVEFDCVTGETYYIVVEAYGTDHLENASGPCTDDGTATGNVISPNYTLSFDVSQSTGCAEDCDNGLDDDLDGIVDCGDDDCWTEPLCCDLDGDGIFALDCLGTDCNDEDATVYSGAPEDGGDGSNNGDGIDNDCDGLIDENTNDSDDDGDGFTENDGDCDDNNPNVHPDAEEVLGNGLDDDCDGYTDSNTSAFDDDGDGFSEDDGDCDDTNAAIHPNAEEDPENGVDDDCDGEIDEVTETLEEVGGKEEPGSQGCTCSSSTQTPWSGIGLWGLFGLLLGQRKRR